MLSWPYWDWLVLRVYPDVFLGELLYEGQFVLDCILGLGV